MGALEAELFEPGEYLRDGPGFFSILAKPNGRAAQQSYELQHLPTVIEGLNPSIDTWISQAVFHAPNRRAVSMQSVGLLFADLDTYKTRGFLGISPEQQARQLVGYCIEQGIPAPSVVLFSGRGLQAKWLLTEALSSDRLEEWKYLQGRIGETLEAFEADSNARDVSRVLRLDRTVNTKSGERCRVVYIHSGIEAAPTRYDFDEIAELFPVREPKKTQENPRRSGKILQLPQHMNLQRLAWSRFHDIRDLWKMRGGVPVGFREVTLFWELNFLLLAKPVKDAEIWQEAQALAAQIDPGVGWYRRSDLSTLYHKAKANLSGEKIMFHGRELPPLYTPKNSTLAEIFHITPEDEQELRTIISTAEKRRREREKRREQGMKPQPYRNHKPWEVMGVSRATYYRKLKAGEIQENPRESRHTRIDAKCLTHTRIAYKTVSHDEEKGVIEL